MGVRTGGRIASTAEVVRELTPEDLLAAGGLRSAPVTQPLAKLRDRHHALARALSTGMSHVEASVVTGYTPERIHQLSNDPAFTELLDFYRGQTTEAVIDLTARMTVLSSDAVNELQDRLEVTPENFTNKELIELVKTTADRTGHGPSPSSTQVNINVQLADRLAAARARAQAFLEAPIVEEAEVLK